MGVQEAYGRAIGTNLGSSSIAQSPPPEPEPPPSPKGRKKLWPGRRGSSAKSESLAGGPHSSYLQLASLIRGLGGNSRDAKCAQIAKSFSHPFRQSKMNCKFATRPNP